MTTSAFVNIAAYKFVGIPEPADWIAPVKEKCQQLTLKGTVILSKEGINLFLAGTRESIDEFLSFVRSNSLFQQRFHDLAVKESVSDNQPFRKMVVRVAREIITMRHPMIRPADSRALAVDAVTLSQWLKQGHDDENREIVLLDTRNKFEVEMGTFEGAIDFDLTKFSEFPEAIRATLDSDSSLKDKTIVSFCTGGIRCEKAALFMQELGHPKVMQLDGGILRYFEDVGGAHWSGDCFVFDERVSLDPKLRPANQNRPSVKTATSLLVCLFVAFAFQFNSPVQAREIIDTPLYGQLHGRVRTLAEKKEDAKYIAEMVTLGTRAQGAEQLTTRGWQYIKAGQPLVAIRRFNQAWLLNPQDPRPYWGMGAAESDLAEFQDAMTLLAKAEKMSTNPVVTSDILSDQGRVLFLMSRRSKNEQEAQKLFAQAEGKYFLALHLNQRCESAYANLAILKTSQKNFPEAWNMVKTARAFGGHSLDPAFVKGLAAIYPEPK